MAARAHNSSSKVRGVGWTRDLREVTGQQHGEDPTVGPADASTYRLYKGDVELQVPVIFREQIVPMIVDAHPLTLKDRAVEIDLHDPDAHPEQVVIQVAARLEEQKDDNHPADQQDRNRRRIGIAECHRQSNPGDDDRPVGGGVETVPPDLALIHLAAIQVGQSTDLRGTKGCLGPMALLVLHDVASTMPPATGWRCCATGSTTRVAKLNGRPTGVLALRT